jgi:hypothetical protein
MVETRVRHNTAGMGGGIVNTGTMSMVRSTVARNVANLWSENQGGGILNLGTLTIRRSTIARNTVVSGEFEAEGGGIMNSGRLTVSESTISGNSARANNGGNGGAIANGSDYLGGPGEVRIESTTVTGNWVEGFVNGAGGIAICSDCEGPSTTTVRASIIAANGLDCFGDFTSEGHNLIGRGGPRCDGFTDGVAHDQVGTRSDPIDARLARLAFNGGRTATHALLPGSPALDAAGAGACVTRWDQRGVGRPQGRRCDIGSFERR